jgi:ABC-2 type transport system ATP-binding protein
MIKIKNLKKVYRSIVKQNNIVADFFFRKHEEIVAVDNISFEIERGELVGFIGPNGAGKTTTLKMLSGILHPTSGNIEVLGFRPFTKKEAFLKQIAFVMGQKNQLLWELPPSDSFQLNKVIYEIDDIAYRMQLQELVELMEAEKLINQPTRSLSLGQRMRVEFIASLLHKPKVLFLDEPTIGLDIFAQTHIIDFIRKYQKKYHSTIILTSHYMKDIQRLAERIILINKGKILFDGKLSTLVTKYAREKEMQIVLKKPVEEPLLKRLNIEYNYVFPILKLKAKKDKLLKLMQSFLLDLEFSDFTLEDEPIEETIKRALVENEK